jgi:hypothetical protein
MSLASTSHRTPFDQGRILRTASLILASILILAAVPEHGQAQTTLKLRQSPDDPATALPVGTEILTLERDGDSAQSLADLGLADRDVLVEEITSRLETEPQNAYTQVVGKAGETERSSFEEKLYYVLALTPQGRLYESHVGQEPGADLVVSGKMRMGPVSTTHRQRMRRAFREAANQGLTTASLAQPLTLRNEDSPLPPETEVRIWTARAAESRGVPDRAALDSTAAKATRVEANGQTGSEFPRTRYSGQVVYVVAQKPDGTLYESQASTTAGYHRVGEEAIEMARVPDVHAALKNQFPGTDSSSGSWGDLLWGPGGWLVALALGLTGAWYYRREVQTLESALEQKEKEVNTLKAENHQNRRRPSYSESQRSPSRSNTERRNAGPSAGRSQDSHRGEPLRASRDRKDSQKGGSESANQSDAPERGGREPHQNEGSTAAEQDDQGPPSDPERTPPASSEPAPKSYREKTGEVFTRWCNEQGPMVDRFQIFKQEVEEEVEGATFRRITRDKNAARLKFDKNALDPVEYWLVEADGQCLLLPQPSRRGFRDLECFDGKEVAPSEVSSVQPAVLEKKGNDFALKEKGRIS